MSCGVIERAAAPCVSRRSSPRPKHSLSDWLLAWNSIRLSAPSGMTSPSPVLRRPCSASPSISARSTPEARVEMSRTSPAMAAPLSEAHATPSPAVPRWRTSVTGTPGMGETASQRGGCEKLTAS